MAAPADYLDAKDLLDIEAGGLIREEVLEAIQDISDIPTPFLDMIGDGSYKNPYSSWTEDQLKNPDVTNARISGSDANSANNDADNANAKRVGNHAQISDKLIMVTVRGENVQKVGRSSEMAYQTARKLQELRRDQEAICLSPQASVEDNGDNVAGKTGTVPSWIVTNASFGVNGAAGGFNTGTKLVAAPTPGELRDGNWEMIATQIENVYILGGNPSVLMSVPSVTKRIGRYLFTTPFAAAPTANVSGNAPSGTAQTSEGYIDTFKTDFGQLMHIVPNRLQQTYQSGDAVPVPVADVFGLDPRFWEIARLYGTALDVLAKVGLSFRKQAHTDWMVRAKLERANFIIRDINPTGAWTSGL